MKTVITVSGGLDTTVLYAHFKGIGDECYPIFFDYGQKQLAQEEKAARAIVGPELYKLQLPYMGMTGNKGKDAVIPARNLVLASLAASYAGRLGISRIALGIHAPTNRFMTDCMPRFVRQLCELLSETYNIDLHTPFANWTKAEVLAYGLKINAPINLSWSCYENGEKPCGQCGACEDRLKAFEMVSSGKVDILRKPRLSDPHTYGGLDAK